MATLNSLGVLPPLRYRLRDRFAIRGAAMLGVMKAWNATSELVAFSTYEYELTVLARLPYQISGPAVVVTVVVVEVETVVVVVVEVVVGKVVTVVVVVVETIILIDIRNQAASRKVYEYPLAV
jgi:hypothetical protein